MAKQNDIKYSEALNELEGIVDELQSETVDVDELSYKVKRAVELIQLCKTKINTTEMDVKQILDDFSADDESTGD